MQLFKANKDENFIAVYEQCFAPFRDKKIRLLEIGVQYGGSLKMWENYFSQAEIVGVDIDPDCRQYETRRIEVRIGSQSDREFLKSLGKFDIVIDDGGHHMSEQTIAYDELFPNLNPGGLYVIEDLQTCFDKKYIDGELTLNILAAQAIGLSNPEVHNTIRSMSFSRKLCVIEKL